MCLFNYLHAHLVGEVYSIMNKCQELNPDPDDEQISGIDILFIFYFTYDLWYQYKR